MNNYNCSGKILSGEYMYIIKYCLNVDTNECDTINGGCNQTCVNEIGNFHCLCNVGYTLDNDGFGCTGKVMNL